MTTDHPAAPSRLVRALPLLLCLLVAFVAGGSFLATAPQVPLPHGPEAYDAAIYPWNFFWARTAAGAPDGSFAFSRRFFHPVGEGLTLYTPTYGLALLSLPFQWVLGQDGLVVAMGVLLWWSGFATAGLTYLIARRLGLGRLAAGVAAVLFTLCGARLMNAPRLNLYCTEFLLLFLWCVLRLLQDGGWRNAVCAALAGALLLFQSQPLFFQAALLLTLAAPVVLVVCLVRRRRPAWAGRPRHVLLAAALLLVLVAPFLSLMLGELAPSWRTASLGQVFGGDLWQTLAREAAGHPALGQSARWLAEPANSLDLTTLVLPGPADRLFGATWAARPMNVLFEGAGPDAAVSLFPGFAWWLLVLVAAAAARPRGLALGLLALTLLSAWVALGPRVNLGGAATGIPSAWTVLRWLPPIHLTKSPIRLALLVQGGMALLAGLGVARLVGAGGRARTGARVAAAVLCLVAAVELAEPLPLRAAVRLDIPERVRSWAGQPDDFAVLDLPFEGHRVTAMAQCLGAYHEHPIFTGLYPRATRRNQAVLQATTLFRELPLHPSPDAPPPRAPADPAAVRADLAALRVRYVLVHDFQDLPPWVHEHAVALGDYFRALGAGEESFTLAPGYTLTVFDVTGTR